MRHVRQPLAILLTVVPGLLSCSIGDAPTEPRFWNDPRRAISDGAHQGNTHFYFLQPMVAAPSYSGSSDADASPTVAICKWDAGAGACESMIAVFSMAEGTGSERLRYDASGEKFEVNWHTDRCLDGPCTLSSASTYRLRVLIGATELGHADVVVGANAQQLKNVNTNEFIPLVNGRTLPVKFRIEVGAVALIPPGGDAVVGSQGGEIATSDGRVALSIPEGAVSAPTTFSIDEVTEELGGTGDWAEPVDLGPDGATFDQPLRLTLAYDASKLPEGVTPHDLQLSTWVDDHWEVVEGSTLNLAEGTISAEISHFSYYVLSIWPNAATYNPPGVIEMTKGQRITLGGYSYYVYTYPRTQCWPEWRWVSTGRNGYWTVRQVCRTWTQYSYYPTSFVRVDWTSSAPGVASFGAPGYTVTDAYGNTTSPTLTALAPGAASITARTFGAIAGPRNLVVLPSLVLTARHGNTPGMFPDSVREIGLDQAFALFPTIPAPIGTDLTVRFSHKSSSILPGVRDTLVIAAGSTFTSGMTVIGRALGVDTIIATATGYGPDTIEVRVGIGGTRLVNWPATLAIGDSAAIRIQPMNPQGLYNDGAYNTTFNLTTSANLRLSDGTSSITTLRHPDAQYTSQVFYVVATGAGPGTIEVTHPNYTPTVDTVDVTGQTFSFAPKQATYVAGWVRGQRVNVPLPMAADVSFSLTSRNRLLIGEAGTSNYTYPGQTGTYVLPAGSTSKLLSIAGLDGVGVDTLIVSAPGFGPDTAVITLVQGKILISGWPATLQAGDSAALTLTVADQSDVHGSLAYPISFTLAPTGRLAFSNGSAPITSVYVQQRTSATFYVKATGFTSGGVTITHRDYLPYTNTVTITPPPLVGPQSVCGHKITGIGYDGSSYWVGEGHDGLLQCLSRFDATTGVLAQVRQIFLDHRGVHWVPALNRLTSRTWAGPIFSIDYATGNLSILASNPTAGQSGNEQSAPAVDPDGQAYWVLYNGHAERHRLADHALLKRFPVTASAGWNTIAVSNDWVFVLDGAAANAYSKATGRLSGRQPLPTVHGCENIAFGASVTADRLMYPRDCRTVEVVPITVPIVEPPLEPTLVATMNDPRYAMAVATTGGRLYAIGGFSDGYGFTNRNESYDPITNQWVIRAAAPTPRWHAAAAAVNGIIYVMGGTPGGGCCNTVTTIEAYNPATDTWTTKAPMPFSREQFGLAVHDGLIYVIGGWRPGQAALASVQAYDPVSETWTDRAPMPAPRAGHGVAVVNGKFYVVGGEGSSFAAPSLEYDPGSNTWTTRASIPTPRTQLGVTAVGGIVYAVGGWLRGNNGGVNTIEAYDPVTDTWSAKPSLNIARFAVGAVTINGAIYVVGGVNQVNAVGPAESYRP